MAVVKAALVAVVADAAGAAGAAAAVGVELAVAVVKAASADSPAVEEFVVVDAVVAAGAVAVAVVVVAVEIVKLVALDTAVAFHQHVARRGSIGFLSSMADYVQAIDMPLSVLEANLSGFD